MMAVAAKRKSQRAAKVDVIRPQGWQIPWLLAGYSTRTGGVSTAFGRHDLNLGAVKGDKPANVERNRQAFIRALRVATSPLRLVTLRQTHSDTIHVIREMPRAPFTGDGMITNVPGLLLAVQVADCVPVLIFDTKKRTVGAFHAGWRGTAKRIVEKGVGLMRMEFGSEPRHLRAAIGPCIMACCYAVGEEVVEQFHSQFDYAADLFRKVFDDDPVKKKYPLLFLSARPPGHSDLGPQVHLDLVEANRCQLLAAGVPAKNIWSADLCTSCNTDRLFSHRKEQGKTGRMMGAVGIYDL